MSGSVAVDRSVEFGAEATSGGIMPVILSGRHRPGYGRNPIPCAIRARIASDCGGRLMLALHRTVLGLAQNSDAFGSGRVGDGSRPFCNRPF